MSVRRVSLANPSANFDIKMARLEGVPVVLTQGPKTWASWAKKWVGNNGGKGRDSPTLDVNEMIEDIGDEMVPVIRHGYNAEAPIHGHILAESYLTKSWLKEVRFWTRGWRYDRPKAAVERACRADQCCFFYATGLTPLTRHFAPRPAHRRVTAFTCTSGSSP